jgi:signal transduction histidine kinase
MFSIQTAKNFGTRIRKVLVRTILIFPFLLRKLESRPTGFYFQTFLDGIVDVTQMQAIERAIRFQVEFSSHLPPRIRADKKILCQVLLNLLGNAVKFIEQGQAALCICSERPCLGVLVERLSIENSKLMPLQRLRYPERSL